MEELQLLNFEKTAITTWDFEKLKTEFSKALSVYKTTVYTDETIKIAKEDKAKLAKVKKVIEDQRKAFKAECMKPYDALEPQIKELVSMIEEQRTAIDEVVKDYTERQRREKEAEIRTFYNKKAHVLGNLAEPLYTKILDEKWLTASSGKKYQEEIQVKINEALSDICVLKAMDSPFEETILEKYAATFSLEEAKAKHEELVIATNKAKLGNQQEKPIASTLAVKASADAMENGTLAKIYGSKRQITQVMDFARALGVKIELQ